MQNQQENSARHWLIVLSLFFAVTPAQSTKAQADDSPSVWTVDLIRTLPGGQAEYLRNIETNWSGARHLAVERGAVLSYQALAAEPDSARGWDVILMTEYVDSTAWSNREEIFTAIFESPEFVRVPMDRPSSELREFVAGGVVMHGVASQNSP